MVLGLLRFVQQNFDHFYSSMANILDRILIDTQQTLHEHLINHWLIVCRVSTDLQELIKN